MHESKIEKKQIQQVCAIPFRQPAAEAEFCLITSVKKQRWIFPKGIIDPGETFSDSALKEAYEEAGLRGQILDHELGRFDDYKWDTPLSVRVVLMEVVSCATDWPEAEQRRRKWVTLNQGRALLHKRTLKKFLAAAAEYLHTLTDPTEPSNPT
ncbi:MAG: NUDIX hydrolase [Pirellulaceae bacterium]|nr:NUDIX hydrolase [Pirellulaceae bacterium]